MGDLLYRAALAEIVQPPGPIRRSGRHALSTSPRIPGARLSLLPDQGRSLLPGLLAATRTGLPPVGDDELVIAVQAKGFTSNWLGARTIRLERVEDLEDPVAELRRVRRAAADLGADVVERPRAGAEQRGLVEG